MSRIDDLHEVEWTDKGLNIGSSVSIHDLCEEIEVFLKNHPEHSSGSLAALLNQCRFFANHQVRNMATIGGGLINFSNYSDLIPLWVATRSTVTFVTEQGERNISLIDQYNEKGEFSFNPQQEGILKSVFVPYATETEIVSSYKYSRRRMDSITFLSAGVSVNINPNTKHIDDIILCFDGLGAPGFRARSCENQLKNKEWNKELTNSVLSRLKEEIGGAISNRLPKRLQLYQQRLAVGILLRFYSKFRQKFYGEQDKHLEDLVSRYPQVAHRSHISFNESSDGILGKAIPHRNAKNQTTGAAKYSADIEVPNCLYGAIVSSPKASGRIISIDASEALSHPDVIAFYTAKDIPGKNLFGFRVEDEEILASEQVGYIGQAIGILVAKSEKMAKEYASLVEVKINDDKALLTFDEAIKAKSFHGKAEGYLVTQGELESSLENSDITITGTVEVPGQSHFYLEPNSSLVIPKDEGFFVYSSTQSPSNVIDHISGALNIEKNHVEVQVGRIGGGFGGKQLRAGPIAAICALASHKLKQPVKLQLEKSEDMAYSPGRSPILANYKAGFTKEGKVKAIDIEFYLNGGYTNDYSADITETATLLMDSCYHIENVKVLGKCLKMNYGTYTSTRGFGKPQASAIIESILDHAASKLSIDATSVRQINLYQKGDLTITKTKIDDDVISSCWNRLIEKSNFQKLQTEVEEFNNKNLWKKRGIAVVSSKGNMGFIESNDINRGLALIHILRDGTVSVNHSGCEMGRELIHVWLK